MKHSIFCLPAIAVSLAMVSCSQPQPEEASVYLFTSFEEPSTAGMRYLYSHDGYHWDTLPGIFLAPQVGNEGAYVNAFTGDTVMPKYAPEQRCLRDPSILRGADGLFHLVWTTQWSGSRGFGYAESKDLIHWSEQRVVDVMTDIPTNNVWAPELFYDDVAQQYMIIWSSAINPEEYTEADLLGTNSCHRMYYTTTKDFVTYTPAQRYYDPGFNSIDGYLLKRAEKDYVLVVKDNRKPGFSNLFCVFSDSPYGPFSEPSETFGRTYSEGPCAIEMTGGEWLIYFDQYHPQQYGAVKTKDFRTFVSMQDSITVPETHKHGTIVKITPSELEALKAAHL